MKYVAEDTADDILVRDSRTQCAVCEKLNRLTAESWRKLRDPVPIPKHNKAAKSADDMVTARPLSEPPTKWGSEAIVLAEQAGVLSGTKLAQLVRRLLRQTGRSHEECWRFVIKYFIKAEADHNIDLTIDFLHAALLKR